MSNIDDILKRWKDIANVSAVRTKPYEYYTTSFPSLNKALGTPGFRGGTMLQLVAQNRTGKTTLAADIVANAQKDGHKCAWIDYECQYDPSYSEKLGIDNSNLILVHPTYINTGSQISEELMEAGVKVIVVDSAPEAQHASEADNKMTDNQRAMGTSGDWTRHLKRMKPIMYNNDALYVVINQFRANTNPKSPKLFDYWGCAEIQYTSGYIIEMVRIKNEEGKATVQCTVIKSKATGNEGHKAELILQHGKGFRADLDIINAAIEAEIITQRGAWLSFGELKAAGKENASLTFPIDEIRKALTNV